jgi:hypothetical protein
LSGLRALAPSAAAWLLLLAAPAAAQERPPALFPARDVAVDYRAQAGAQGETLRTAWLAAQERVRVEGPNGWFVADRRARTGFLVMPGAGGVVELGAGAPAAGRILPDFSGARFTRLGAERIAGLDCTLWRVEQAGARRSVCLTAEGVMLRTAEDGAEAINLVAQAVRFGAQDPARFERPAPPRATPPAGGAFPQRGTALPPPGLER